MFLALAEIRRSAGRFALLGGAVGLLVLLLLFFQTVGGALVGGLTGAFEEAQADVWVFDDQARGNPQASVLDDRVRQEVADVSGVAAAAAATFTVFDVDGSLAAVVATDAGSPALPRGVADGLPRDDQVVAGSSTFVGGAAPATVELGDRRLEVVDDRTGATFNVLPTYFVSRDVVAAAATARAGREVPLPPSVIAVRVAAGEDPVAVAAAITDDVPGVEAVDRATAVAGLPGAGVVSRSFSILYLLLYLVVTIVTAVFFLILTVQKRDSLVLLRAVGAGRGDVVRPVLVQVLVVVGAAVTLGSLVAYGLLSAARDVFGAALELRTVATSGAALLALGLLAGTLSLRRVVGVEPVEAVRTGGL